MNDTTVIHTSRAQYRILRRLARGEVLTGMRYRPEHATMRALDRKGLVEHVVAIGYKPSGDIIGVALCDSHWKLTELGQRVAAARNGFLALRSDGTTIPGTGRWAAVEEHDTPPRHGFVGAHWRANAVPTRRPR